MRRFQWLAAAAAIAALGACSDGDDDVNMTNVEVDAADENMLLPPVDTNVDVNVDGNLDTNAVDNSANNTANAY